MRVAPANMPSKQRGVPRRCAVAKALTESIIGDLRREASGTASLAFGSSVRRRWQRRAGGGIGIGGDGAFESGSVQQALEAKPASAWRISGESGEAAASAARRGRRAK